MSSKNHEAEKAIAAAAVRMGVAKGSETIIKNAVRVLKSNGTTTFDVNGTKVELSRVEQLLTAAAEPTYDATKQPEHPADDFKRGTVEAGPKPVDDGYVCVDPWLAGEAPKDPGFTSSTGALVVTDNFLTHDFKTPGPGGLNQLGAWNAHQVTKAELLHIYEDARRSNDTETCVAIQKAAERSGDAEFLESIKKSAEINRGWPSGPARHWKK